MVITLEQPDVFLWMQYSTNGVTRPEIRAMLIHQESLECGHELLPGIVIEQELADSLTDRASSRLFLVHDFRTCPDVGMVRFARVFPPPTLEESDWIKQVRARIDRLLPLRLPFVLTPIGLATTSAGWVCYLESLWRYSLEDQLRANSVMQGDNPGDLLEQILIGLAELHDHGIAHGDLRPGNIALIPMGNQKGRSAAWLANAAFGGLTVWSKGKYVAPDAKQYFPPEWHGQAGDPTPRADLYALGIVAHKMIHGARSTPSPFLKVTFVHRCWGFLRHLFCDTEIDGASRMLLNGPHGASQVLQRFRRWRIWVSWRLPVLFTLAIAVVLQVTASGLGIWASHVAAHLKFQNQQIQIDLDRAKSEIQKLLEKHSEQAHLAQENRSEIAIKNAKIAELEVKDRREGAPIPIETARKAWILALDESNKGSLPQMGTKPFSESDQRQFQAWQNIVLDAQSKSGPWRDHDHELTSLFRDLVASPWEIATVASFERRLANLSAATKVWGQWASNDKLHFEDLRSRTGGETAEVQRILHGWLNETEERSSWSIRLVSGTAPVGHGKYRGIGVYGDQWSEDWHDWDHEISHQYHDHMLNFEWTAGKGNPKPLYLTVQANLMWLSGGISRPYRIYQTFSGPLPIWSAHQAGSVSQNGFSLEFDVINCPGPPRLLLKSLNQGVLK